MMPKDLCSIDTGDPWKTPGTAADVGMPFSFGVEFLVAKVSGLETEDESLDHAVLSVVQSS
jgi:hypothetical protein